MSLNIDCVHRESLFLTCATGNRRQNFVYNTQLFLTRAVTSHVFQVESLRNIMDGLESSLGITRVELEGAISRTKKGELETRKVEEALHKLQNDRSSQRPISGHN